MVGQCALGAGDRGKVSAAITLNLLMFLTWGCDMGLEAPAADSAANQSPISGRWVGKVIGDSVRGYTWSDRQGKLIETACSRLMRNLNTNEWAFYFSEEPYRLLCPTLP